MDSHQVIPLLFPGIFTHNGYHMSDYCLLLGTARELCLAELEWLLKPFQVSVTPISSNFVRATLTSNQVAYLSLKSGGIVKIAKIIDSSTGSTAETIVTTLKAETKVVFSVIGHDDKSLSKTIKQLHPDRKILLGKCIICNACCFHCDCD